jgi:hypothetical protein
MIKLEKLLYGFVSLERTKLNKVGIEITFNDMFDWATSWGLGIVTDYDKPIQAYRHFNKYLKDNNIDFYEKFDSVPYPKEKTEKNLMKYFIGNRIVYNELLDSLKDYNDFTRNSLEKEKISVDTKDVYL